MVVRLVITIALATGLAGGLLGAVPTAAAAEQPAVPTGPDSQSLPEVELGKPRVPAGMETNNDPGDAQKAPLPDNDDERNSQAANTANVGRSAGGKVALPPHVGEESPEPAKFDEANAELVDQDATTRTFENPDGSFTLEASPDVARVQDADGHWHAP